MNHIQPIDDTAIIDARTTLYEQAKAMTLGTVAPSSRRVYEHVWRCWEDWAAEDGLHPLMLTFENVSAFLSAADLAKSTKQRRLSALRSLASNFELIDPDNAARWQAAHNALRKVKITSQDSRDSGRRVKALTAREVYAAFDTWDGDSLTHVRNRALLAVAFYAGLRRSEIVALTWDDIDLETGMIHVRAGKGDKERTTPLVSDDAIPFIEAWKQVQAAIDPDRRYVFCGVRNRGQGELREDTPMSTTAVYKVMKTSGDFAPHDARRTLITAMLNAGTSVADAQYIAGHSQPQTTLRYAKVGDATAVKGRVKVSY